MRFLIIFLIIINSCSTKKTVYGYYDLQKIEKFAIKDSFAQSLFAKQGNPTLISDDGKIAYYIKIFGYESKYGKFIELKKEILSIHIENGKIKSSNIKVYNYQD